MLVLAVLKFFLEKQAIIQNLNPKTTLYSIAGLACLSIFLKSKIIFKYFREYFEFNAITIIPAMVEIMLVIPIFFYDDVYAIISGIAFFISGFQRIVIQKSKALFKAELSEFSNFMQAYAYTRAMTYLVLLIALFNFIKLDIFNQTEPFEALTLLAFFLITSGISIRLLMNLYPYWKKHIYVRRTVELIRLIAENEGIKKNQVFGKIKGASHEFLDKQTKQLITDKFFEEKNKRLYLSSDYKYILKK